VITILRKREAYRRAFDNFDAGKIANYKASQVRALMNDAGIVRNRLKQECGSFDAFIWQFVGGAPIVNRLKPGDRVAATTPESDAMSKALEKHGFTFVGSTICYAFMQATGMVNDHVIGCAASRA
jgi:DNA-3-methyladenine glycosylase I